MAHRKLYRSVEKAISLGLSAVLALCWFSGEMLRLPHGDNILASVVILTTCAAGVLIPVLCRRHGPVTATLGGVPLAKGAQPLTDQMRYGAARTLSRAATPPAEIDAQLPPMADVSVDDRLSLHTLSRGMPVAFAALCARQLLRAGWRANPATQLSRKCAHVIAERDGWRIVLQCAIGPGAVGFRAVQDATVARVDDHAAMAAVVSASGYTAAAQHLAAQNRILLLHYRDLSTLDRVLARKDLPPIVATV